MAQTVVRDTFDQPQPITVVGTAQTVVVAPVDLIKYDRKCFSIRNAPGGQAFNTGKVQSTRIENPLQDSSGRTVGWVPSSTDADWEDVDTTTFATLASGAFKTAVVKEDARKWFRVVATVASTTTTVQAFVTAGGVS
jgi:hypothetical protein